MPYRFREFRLEPASRELLRDGQRVVLPAEVNAPGEWMQAMAETALARRHCSTGRRDAALALHASALSRIVRVGAPIDTIGVAEPYLLALIKLARFDEAKAVNGQNSAWADRDLRAASAQTRLFAALGEAEAAQRASRLAARLSGSVES